MVRLTMAVVITVAVVSFAMVNTHPVTLSFVFGPPVKVRLIFLMMSSFLFGMLFLGFFMMAWRLRTRARTRPVPRQEADLVQQ